MIDLIALIHQCAPTVVPRVLYATIRTESGFNPLALHVNGNLRLQRPSKTAAEADAWSSWLIGHGYSVDMGLMQINSHNLASRRLTPLEAFDGQLSTYVNGTVAVLVVAAVGTHGRSTSTLTESCILVLLSS